MRNSKFVLSVCLIALFMMASISSASVLLSDDFDGGPASGSITGQLTDTGQTWGLPTWIASGVEYNTFTSADGTQGGGTSVSWGEYSVATFTASATGVLRLEADMVGSKTSGDWSGTSATQIQLADTANGTTLEMELNLSAGTLGAGILVSDSASIFDDGIGGAPYIGVGGIASIVVDIDLDAKTVSYSWDASGNTYNASWVFGIDGSSGPLSYTADFNPNQVVFGGASWANGINGVDNLVISDVPEPATMALLGLGGLLLRKRSKR